MTKYSFLHALTCYHFLLCQVCETVSLLQQLWPEGSDIRRVFCVTSCSLFLEMYHCYLENREKEKGASAETSKVKQVWLLHWDTGCFTGIQAVTSGYTIDFYCCFFLIIIIFYLPLSPCGTGIFLLFI